MPISMVDGLFSFFGKHRVSHVQFCPRLYQPFAVALVVISLLTGRAAAQDDWPVLKLTQVVSGTSAPTQITNAHDGSGRIFVVEQAGRIRILQNGAFLSTAFLDISNEVLFAGPNGEQGMLSVVFPPNYNTKGYFYASYTRALDGATVISRFSLTSNANVADASSEQVILAIPQPAQNHKSGQLAFGPDGYLYIGVGDGDGEQDPNNEAQTTSTLLGKLLRIDTESGATPYAVPPTNPFVNNPAYQPEIWALGLRNPWRFSFDRQTGDLYIADVGQDSYEEVDYQPAGSLGGQNYGWRVMEGFKNYNVPPGFNLNTLTLPVIAFPHNYQTGGFAVIGGFVYRGPSIPRMNGVYIFGDYTYGFVWGMKYNGSAWQLQRLLSSGIGEISTFGEDEAGNIYVADYLHGLVYSISDTPITNTVTANPPTGTLNGPTNVQLVSDTGATIYYTLNGTAPTTSSASVISGATVLVAPGQQVQAFAVLSGYSPSASVSVSYSFQAGAPQFTPANGPITQPTVVSIGTATPGATIYYTTDGTTPTTNSPVYSTPFTVNPPETVQAIAICSGYQNSTVSSNYYGLLIQENTTVTTIAGGTQGYLDGPASIAQFNGPQGLCLDANGVLYVADSGNNAIRTITPAAQVSTLAGGTYGFVNGSGTSAEFNDPVGICLGPNGNLYVTDTFNYAIRMVTLSGQVSTVASGVNSGFGTIGVGILFNGSGTLYVSDFGRVEYVEGTTVTVFAGPGSGNINGWQDYPGLALAPSGTIDVSSNYGALSTVSTTGVTAALAGGATQGFSDGPAATARFYAAGAMCCDVLGNLYVCDQGRVRKVTPAGIVSTLAGSSQGGFADGPGGNATFGRLTGICVTPQGVVYVSDDNNNAIRKITQANPYPAFMITKIIPDGNGGMALSWPTVAGVSYQIEYSSDLVNWQNVGNVVTGDGTTKTTYDDTMTGISRRFYRATIVMP